MRQYRIGEEALTDKAVLLGFLYRVGSRNDGVLGDRLKMQKLTFLFCHELFKQRIKALNYIFFTYRWGPFTKDLYEAEADFEQADLMHREGRVFSLTETGVKWGQSIYDALGGDPYNCEIVETMDAIVDRFSRNSTQTLVDYSRAMNITPIGWHETEQLDELPLHLDLTAVVDEEEATAIIEIDRGLLDSFAMALAFGARFQAVPAI
ncbi:MAG: hypothetical protein OXI16_11390 [Chloroflexota bacterium]|nr:hypothetical protein [Chloroflexota bacterium]